MKKTVLVTGGTGFLGKRLGLALKDQYRTILAGRNNKLNFHAKEITQCEVVPMDVVHIESIRDVFNEFRPHIVIHAAATKFVDLAEKQPMECIDVNVVGSQNIARVAMERNVESVIGISTDKASPPIRNIYGLTKALMERAFCSLNGKSSTKFCCVRYGNVAWSTGSVLPAWKMMHEENGLIRTTGPEMRRFFFTVDEAVNLVITGLNNINEIQGKVLTRRMKAAKIEDILNLWVSTKGGKWERIVGRPGDRTDEFLIGELELPFACEKGFGGITHYVISFNQRVEKPLQQCISTANAVRLNEREILSIINNPPLEER
jgi:UDP-N-acetylglucosamine 4,6-dehydratase